MQRPATRTLRLWAVVAWSFAVTVARAIRMPDDFSEAHRFGFMKRGLLGSLCGIAGRAFGFTMSPRITVVGQAALGHG